MQLLLIAVFVVGCTLAFHHDQGERDDYSGKALQFFSGADKLAAQAEMTPSPGCVEGDMLLSDEQKEVYLAMRAATAEDRERVRRDAGNYFKIWPNKTFVYQFDDIMSATTKQIVEEAIQIYKENTNIKFLEAIKGSYTGSVVPLIIQQTGKGCYATVGFSGVGGGKINLQEKSCDAVGIALHEIGHALFRFHEQTRSDRDDYVTVLESNILSGYEVNFAKADRATIGPYDMQSIMHYHSRAFSIDGSQPTIVPVNPNDADKMGKQHKLSRLDIFAFNTAYGAYENCPSDLWDQCKRGGVPSKHCTCNCLPAFEGPYCEIFVPPSDCSVIYNTASGTIKSPGFPGVYSSNSDCTYVVECDEHEVVELDFVVFELEDWNCWYDTMKMMTGALFSEIYPDEYCGDELQGQKLVTARNLAIMTFESDGWYNFPGFQIDFKCLNPSSSISA